MIPQEIFDTVAKHLFKQGHQAITTLWSGYSDCAYRTPNGDKCAAGAILPDEYYQSFMEGYSISHLVQMNFKLPEWIIENLRLISDLQTIHDQADNWKFTQTMIIELKKVAKKFELDSEVLNHLEFADR